jgi:hypothetical protein
MKLFRRGNRNKSTSPPYSPEFCRRRLAPAEVFLFPRLKSIIKGACFAEVAVIQERVTAVLRSIPKVLLLAVYRKFINVSNSVL